MLERYIAILKWVFQNLNLLPDIFIIRTSGLFDGTWYLEQNPDVAHAKINPLLHYLVNGGFERRDPGPGFSSGWYIDTYEDVGNSGMNPLIHYLKRGRKEGREPQPVASFYKKREQDRRVISFLPRSLKRQKVFCIGLNKTGTTTMAQVLRDFGYKVGVQWRAELLMDDWAMRDFRRIVQYCKTADAFQDVPFSLDFTYQIVDYAFPGSKFILTIRNNADEWYESLVRFHAKLMGTEGTPTVDDVKNFSYRGRGWGWRQQQNMFGTNDTNVYDEKLYKKYYTNHNAQILEYFKSRPKDLLVLDLSEPSAMRYLCDFLGVEYSGQVMPHLNKSKEDNTF